MKGKEKALMAAATPLFFAVFVGLTGGAWDAELLAFGAAGLFTGLVVYFTPNASANSEGGVNPPSKAKKDDVFRS